jgi:hypothetical protein
MKEFNGINKHSTQMSRQDLKFYQNKTFDADKSKTDSNEKKIKTKIEVLTSVNNLLFSKDFPGIVSLLNQRFPEVITP